MHVLAIHTPRRAAPRRVARVHNTCLTPARCRRIRTARTRRETELFRRCTISDGPSNVIPQDIPAKKFFATVTKVEDTNKTFVINIYVSICEAYSRICEIARFDRNLSLFLPIVDNFFFFFFFSCS